MEQPCVRVAREQGEQTRQRLEDAGVLDGDRSIVVEDDTLFIPVVSAAVVPDGLTVVDRETPQRETPTTPDELVSFDVSYERLGDIVLIDEDDQERARKLTDAVLESDLPATTVLDRASKISGELRVRDWNILAGDETETVHREYGTELLVDPTEVYFSPRLATERQRVVDQIDQDERVFDMFAGVGPFAVPAAERGARVVGVDKNERAIEYLRENAARNGVEDWITAIAGDVRDVAPEYESWADRIIMNLPHSADEFLSEALTIAGDECVLHYYDIQHEDDPFGPGIDAIEAAAGSKYDVVVETKRRVRSYAPHELNVCLDVRLRRR